MGENRHRFLGARTGYFLLLRLLIARQLYLIGFSGGVIILRVAVQKSCWSFGSDKLTQAMIHDVLNTQ